jgi:hypothetical protein
VCLVLPLPEVISTVMVGGLPLLGGSVAVLAVGLQLAAAAGDAAGGAVAATPLADRVAALASKYPFEAALLAVLGLYLLSVIVGRRENLRLATEWSRALAGAGAPLALSHPQARARAPCGRPDGPAAREPGAPTGASGARRQPCNVGRRRGLPTPAATSPCAQAPRPKPTDPETGALSQQFSHPGYVGLDTKDKDSFYWRDGPSTFKFWGSGRR